MKIVNKLTYKVITCMLAAGILFAAAGCQMVFDDQDPCVRGIRLKLYYDYNMKYADAFPAEVKNVSVYVSDHETGAPITQLHVPVGSVKEHEFEVNLDYLPAGRYDFLIWCFGETTEYFTINPTKAEEAHPRDNTCLMNEDTDNPNHQSHDIGRLYHGEFTNADCSKENEIVTIDVPLIKNTNVVHLVLQHLDGTYLDPEQFDISLESDNGHMNHENDLIRGNLRVYHPYLVRSGTTDMEDFMGNDSRAITSASALVAEHTIGRIVKDNSVTLRVRNTDTGEEIINIPFIDYALLVKGKGPRPMTDQEYLDRQDEYSMVFFLDKNLRRMNKYIYINSWRLVLQDTDL